MTAIMDVTVALAAVNGLLALWVGIVYARNHRQIRSGFTLALALFAVFLVFHNALLIYHLVSMMATFTGQAEWFLLGEGLLQLVALGALAWATSR